ncbi:MAG TPA: UDP-N-acetylmuramoyl-L-alanine--D-glutamate ligase [Bacteroidales bacterium]|nr:UDP-N-acetylmuramoyl-L-alanine--D-glutamate ligase [Bacteroidales bacterium]
MNDKLIDHFRDKRILILGFGLEGQSTYRFLRRHFPELPLAVADRDPGLPERVTREFNDPHLHLIPGQSLSDSLPGQFDLVMKSPGVVLPSVQWKEKLTSQTEISLQWFKNQMIGVTGTKGKSTTASLLFHILQLAGKKVTLAGNIGIPPFDLIDQWDQETCIVFEMSSHQLEHVTHSPHIGILLNVYQEHLDHYPTFADYQRVKLNIFRYQQQQDYHIINQDDGRILMHLSRMDIPSAQYGYSLRSVPVRGCILSEDKTILFHDTQESSEFPASQLRLQGDHNLMNCMAAVCASKIAGVSDGHIQEGLNTFRGLAHRMEYVGTFGGILFYDDSIATVPEATIHAVRTLKNVDTLILGGYDRGIDYAGLADFLADSSVSNLIFTGRAGERIRELILSRTEKKRLFSAGDYAEAMEYAGRFTRKGWICLLSPAAASYGMFRNFMERGDVFCSLARKI